MVTNNRVQYHADRTYHNQEVIQLDLIEMFNSQLRKDNCPDEIEKTDRHQSLPSEVLLQQSTSLLLEGKIFVFQAIEKEDDAYKWYNE